MDDTKSHKILSIVPWGILLFWALWSSLAAISDLINLLQQLHIVPSSWIFSSGNFSLVLQSLSKYGWDNHLLAIFLFAIIVTWIFVVAILFWRALFAFNKTNFLRSAYLAFIVSMAMNAFFLIMDELFLQYEFGHSHMARLGFRLITFIAFYLLSRHCEERSA